VNIKKLKALLLAVLMVGCLVLTCGCNGGGGNEEGPAEQTYKVSIVDALGAPYTSGIIVRILDANQEQVAMLPITETGTVEKTLTSGSYTVELKFTGNEADYHYEKTGLELTAEKPELQVVLTMALNQEVGELIVGGKAYDAYSVTAGSTHVALTAGQMTYFLFSPEIAGLYEFSTQGEGVEIGYYGAPHFVQSTHVAEDPVVDNKFTVSIKADMIGTGNTGTTVLVLGLKSADAEEAVINIARIGDPIRTVEDEPWVTYQVTAELKDYQLPEGAELKLFDITADSYTLVFNETDGFYHLDTADGPLVLVNLGNSSQRQYLDAFETIVEKSRVCKYFYDDSGNFIKRESYSECLMEYILVMDEDKGVYPLTEDLKYIIQQRGEYYGWFDISGKQYLFKDENGVIVQGVNDEISWLFMCSYIAG